MIDIVWQGLTKSDKDLQLFAGICWDLQGFAENEKAWQGLARTVKDCQGLLTIRNDWHRLARISKLARIARDWQGLAMFGMVLARFGKE